MTIYKLYSAATATADSAASLDIVADGRIVCVVFTYGCTTTTRGRGRWELSFSSSNGFTANDTRSAVIGFSYHVPEIVSASNTWSQNAQADLPEVAVAMGERLYIHHVAVTAVASMETSFFIYVDDKTGSAGRRVRL